MSLASSENELKFFNQNPCPISSIHDFSTFQYMDFQSIVRVSPKGHLPEELCREILSRLPVKSLLRFCCVSKSWLSLIKDPDFHRLHLQNFKDNHDGTHLLVVEGRSLDCVVRCSSTLEKQTGTLLTLGEFYESYWRIKCFVDGLVLLKSWEGRLRIWNPSIRKLHDIPTLPEIETYDNFHETLVGLGYDALVGDYKCVEIVEGNSNQPPLVAVYTLGAGSWKIIPFQVNEGGSDCVWIINSITKRVYLQGNLYFLVDHLEEEVLELGWFDVSREVFCSIDLPEDDDDWFDSPVALVCTGCSSLALIIICNEGLTVWVFESKSMCWTECHENLDVPEYFYLNKNGDMLMWGFSEDNEDHSGSTFYRRVVSSYNLETKQEKILLIQKNTQEYDGMPEFVCGHNESLLLLK